MRMTARPIGGPRLVARRKNRRLRRRLGLFDRANVCRHRQLLKQQAEQREKREQTAMSVAAENHVVQFEWTSQQDR